MNRETIENDTKIIVAEIVGVNVETIDNNASFVGDLDFDSVRMLETIAVLERKYRIRIPEDDILTIRTINNAIDVVLSIIKENNEE